MSDSAPLGNFASTAGMWWEYCKAQKACNNIENPRLPMVNVVYCIEDSSILICQTQTSVQGMKITSTYQTFQGFLDPR